MPNYTVFLGFQIDAVDGDTARSVARDMVDGHAEFPDEVSCVGFEFTPSCTEQLAIALVVLGKSMQEVQEDETHANN